MKYVDMSFLNKITELFYIGIHVYLCLSKGQIINMLAMVLYSHNVWNYSYNGV